MRNAFVITALLLLYSPCKAADLFGDEAVLEITLTGPLHSLIRHKEDEKAFPFVLEVNGDKIPVMASARGNSRKKVCYFPPIKLEFDEPEKTGEIFAGQKSLKLVTHCNKSSMAQDNAIDEFAAYRFFNLLSEASYRVRLLNIDYVDSENRRSASKYAFVIESTGSLTSRVGGERARLPAISLSQMNHPQLALVFLFQYVIGNTDFSLVAESEEEDCCHNGRLISKKNELLYVPYDFDLAGLVDAKYAFPDPSFRIKKVTQRLYRGFCLDRQVLAAALRDVNSRRADYSEIIDGLPHLSKSAKNKAHRFLERFFDEAGDEQAMLDTLEQRCLD